MTSVRGYSTWQVWRPQPVNDGMGGQVVMLSQVTTERGDMRPLTAREHFELSGSTLPGQRAGAEHSHRGWFRARANIVRNDELRRDNERLVVTSVQGTFPEGPGARLAILARGVEAGG